MILKASKRCGASALALHLLNEDDNDHIRPSFSAFRFYTVTGARKAPISGAC